LPSNTFIGTTASAIKGSLLDRPTVEKLAESTSLEEMVNRLKATQYGVYLAKLAPPFGALHLELAFRERLADVHFGIMSLSKGYDLISSYYLRQIAWDLKSLLKSKALGRSTEESMEYLTMHAEELVGRRDLVVRIVSARDIQEVPSLLGGTEFSEDVSEAVSVFLTKKEVRVFDLFIDHAVMSAISRAYSSRATEYSSPRAVDVAGIREMVAIDMDSFNVLSILRAKLWKLPEEEIRGLVVRPIGMGGSSGLQAMISAESIPEAIKAARGAFPQSFQTGGTDEEAIDSLETYLTGESSRVARRSFAWQGLSMSLGLALVKLLEFEVKNLAAISIGIEAGVDPKGIISRMVL
jgi:V/A-type H+-transporting ATPase subunit C